MKKETDPQQFKDYIENSIESKNMTQLDNKNDYGVVHLVQLLVVEEVVLLCILSQFELVKFGWELSGLVWFGMDVFGLVQLSSVWYG